MPDVIPNRIRIALAKACAPRGWGLREVADAASLEYEYVKRLAYGTVRNHSGWRAIERTLEVPIWHSPELFTHHQRALRVLGIDAITEPADKVRAAALRFDFIRNVVTKREPRIATILAIIATLTPEQVEAFAAQAGPHPYYRPPAPPTEEQMAADPDLDLRHPPERQPTR